MFPKEYDKVKHTYDIYLAQKQN